MAVRSGFENSIKIIEVRWLWLKIRIRGKDAGDEEGGFVHRA